MIGQILRQRYKIVKKLGSGGFGETYLAQDLDIPIDPKPLCVVKRLQPANIDPTIERLFEQEAQMLYKLGQNHHQIPRLTLSTLISIRQGGMLSFLSLIGLENLVKG